MIIKITFSLLLIFNDTDRLICLLTYFQVALASFSCYVVVDEKNVLNASKAFVSLSLFNILRFPLTMLPHLISFLIMVNINECFIFDHILMHSKLITFEFPA